CVETVHPTTLLDPVYVVSGVVHYGVANMPALVPRTSTFALTNATLPYVLELATRGVAGAARANAALAKGINVARGRVVHPAGAARQRSRLGNDQPSLSSFVVRRAVPTARIGPFSAGTPVAPASWP